MKRGTLGTRPLILLFSTLIPICLARCSGRKVQEPLSLSEVKGKKVALVDIDGGEDTAQAVVETALVNQLVRRGTFILVSKQAVEAAKAAPDQDLTDWKGLARRAGADYALRAKILDFTANTRTGYSSETVEDSRLAEETGEGKTERLYKVKRMTGHVAVDLDFAGVTPDTRGASRHEVAEATDQVTSEGRTEAAHLPPKLRFLEKIANVAFQRFFQRAF